MVAGADSTLVLRFRFAMMCDAWIAVLYTDAGKSFELQLNFCRGIYLRSRESLSVGRIPSGKYKLIYNHSYDNMNAQCIRDWF